MSTHASLRSRIAFGVLCFTVFISLATSLLGYWVNEQAEQRVWESMFRSELAQRALGRPDGDAADADDAFLVFGTAQGRPMPAEFAQLGAGVHDEVRLGSRLYVISIQGEGRQATALALDITEMEQRESKLAFLVLAAGLGVVLLLAAVTYLAAQWLVKPLAQLSAMIARLRPGTPGQQLQLRAGDPQEVAVISGALNDYLRDIDRYVERERRFLTMASHELRTPIAVVSGAAEVAIEQPTVEQSRVHVARIIKASRGMQELVAMLLALARDPARLRAGAVPLDLATLVCRVVADHEHLLVGKELTIVYDTMASIEVELPEAIAAAALGNLVRNAIENSSRGLIRVSLDASGTFAIRDPGSNMSPEETSRLQVRLARIGQGQGGGIGLDLVTRLCEHLGWTLELKPVEGGGTSASLSFRHRA